MELAAGRAEAVPAQEEEAYRHPPYPLEEGASHHLPYPQEEEACPASDPALEQEDICQAAHLLACLHPAVAEAAAVVLA